MITDNYSSEIVLGLITTLGTDTDNVIRYMREHLSKFSYKTEIINVSSEILNEFEEETFVSHNEYEHIKHYMDLGNKIRN